MQSAEAVVACGSRFLVLDGDGRLLSVQAGAATLVGPPRLPFIGEAAATRLDVRGPLSDVLTALRVAGVRREKLAAYAATLV